MKRIKLLFVCTSNQLRSVTAENIYKDNFRYEVLSCGTDSMARVTIDVNLITWSDMVFVFENEHTQSVIRRRLSERQEIYNLDIKDIYDRDQPELIELIRRKVDAILVDRDA